MPHHVIKFSPLHFINFYPTFQLAYEFKIKDNYSLQVDIGYVLPASTYDPEFQDKRGVKLKTELRCYMAYATSKKGAHYFSAEPYANIINFDRETQQTECFDVDCTILYTRTYNYKVKLREPGVSIKYGIQWYAKRIVFDFNSGLTLRFVNYIKPNIVNGFNEFEGDDWSFDIPNETNRVGLRPIVGFRIGYRIE